MKTIRETEYTKVIVLDEPGEGGAYHDYIVYMDIEVQGHKSAKTLTHTSFQKGPIKENGVNGCQIEDLLAICIHRLDGFQAGKFPSAYNEHARYHLNVALENLNKRTEDRKQRGVEGDNKE